MSLRPVPDVCPPERDAFRFGCSPPMLGPTQSRSMAALSSRNSIGRASFSLPVPLTPPEDSGTPASECSGTRNRLTVPSEHPQDQQCHRVRKHPRTKRSGMCPPPSPGKEAAGRRGPTQGFGFFPGRGFFLQLTLASTATHRRVDKGLVLLRLPCGALARFPLPSVLSLRVPRRFG